MSDEQLSSLDDSDCKATAEMGQERDGTATPRPLPLTPTQRPEAITWLHLSDLHFHESRTYNENIVLKALLRDITERIQQDGLRPAFIAVTGDVAFSGKSAEYALARPFFDDLLITTGLPRERLFVVPGNHDVDRDLITVGAKAIGASLTDRDSVKTLHDTPDDRRLVLARFKGYAEFVNDYFAGHLAFDDEHYFYVQTLDLSGRRIALLGLNSAWLCVSDQDKEQGLVIGERQTRAALDAAQAAGPELKIVLLHHPFDWLREFDRNDSEALLLDNSDFVLHGHLHHTAMAQLVSPDSGAMVIAGGACYETRQYPNSYNFVRLDLSTGTGTVYLRRYSDARGGFWAKDTLLYRNVPEGEYTFRLLKSEPAPFLSMQVSEELQSNHEPKSLDEYPDGELLTKMIPHIDPDNPPVAAIRNLLLAAFTPEDLRRFCQNQPAFRPLIASFSSGHGLDDMIDRVIDYCRTKLMWDELLAEVARVNPRQYARFESSLRGYGVDGSTGTHSPRSV